MINQKSNSTCDQYDPQLSFISCTFAFIYILQSTILFYVISIQIYNEKNNKVA